MHENVACMKVLVVNAMRTCVFKGTYLCVQVDYLLKCTVCAKWEKNIISACGQQQYVWVGGLFWTWKAPYRKSLPWAGTVDKWVPADGGGKHAVRVWSQWSQIRMSLWSRGSHTVQFEGDHEILKKQSECKALILFQCHVLKTMLYPHLVVSKVQELLKICLQICCYVFLYQHHVKVFIKK